MWCVISILILFGIIFILVLRDMAVNREADELAENGGAAAQYNRGEYYIYEDTEKAKYWFGKSAANGYEKARDRLRIISYAKMINVKKIRKNGKGKEYFDAWSAYTSRPDNCEALGRAYKHGYVLLDGEIYLVDGLEMDKEMAVSLFKRAAGGGDVEGIYYLGTCYLFGEGVDIDEERGCQLLHIAAERGREDTRKESMRLIEIASGMSYDKFALSMRNGTRTTKEVKDTDNAKQKKAALAVSDSTVAEFMVRRRLKLQLTIEAYFTGKGISCRIGGDGTGGYIGNAWFEVGFACMFDRCNIYVSMRGHLSRAQSENPNDIVRWIELDYPLYAKLSNNDDIIAYDTGGEPIGDFINPILEICNSMSNKEESTIIKQPPKDTPEEWFATNSKLLGGNSKDGMKLTRRAMSQDRVDVMELFTAHGLQVDKKNTQGETYMHIAMYEGGLEVVKWLKEKHKLDINEPRSDGDVPICIAAGLGHIKIVEWLLDSGVDINVS